MLACVACGSWASSKPIGLLDQCPGVPAGRAGAQALRLLGAGLHPVHRTPIPALWSLSQAEALASKVQAPGPPADP
eukprot:15788476-Heterocapsa_arctica.AAC.1